MPGCISINSSQHKPNLIPFLLHFSCTPEPPNPKFPNSLQFVANSTSFVCKFALYIVHEGIMVRGSKARRLLNQSSLRKSRVRGKARPRHHDPLHSHLVWLNSYPRRLLRGTKIQSRDLIVESDVDSMNFGIG